MRSRKKLMLLGLAISVFIAPNDATSKIVADYESVTTNTITNEIKSTNEQARMMASPQVEIKTEEVEFVSTHQEEIVEEREYIGKFRISHYCLCKKCNYPYQHTIAANGENLVVDYSIAVDPKIIPLNSMIEIDGYDGERKAMDTGGKIKGNRIDVLVSSHKLAYELGVKKEVDVYLVKESD